MQYNSSAKFFIAIIIIISHNHYKLSVKHNGKYFSEFEIQGKSRIKCIFYVISLNGDGLRGVIIKGFYRVRVNFHYINIK